MSNRIPVHLLKKGQDPTEQPSYEARTSWLRALWPWWAIALVLVAAIAWWWLKLPPFSSSPATPKPALAAAIGQTALPTIVRTAAREAAATPTPPPTETPETGGWRVPFQTAHALRLLTPTPRAQVSSANGTPSRPRTATPRSYPAANPNQPRVTVIYRTVVVFVTATATPTPLYSPTPTHTATPTPTSSPTPTARPITTPGPLIYQLYLPGVFNTYTPPVVASYTMWLPLVSR